MTLDEYQAIVTEQEETTDNAVKIDWHDNFPFTRLHGRRDMHGMLLLDVILSRGCEFEHTDMVSAAEHDQVWLDVDMHTVLSQVTHDEVKQLHACGVHIDAEYDCFHMFV